MSKFDGLFDDITPRGIKSYTLDGVRVRSAHEVRLHVQHAGASNPAYMRARRKFDGDLKASSGALTNERLIVALIPLFAKHVITGWDNVFGADGKPIACSPEEVEAFLTELAKGNIDLVDRMMGYALNGDHFREVGGSAEALGNG